MTNEQDNTIRYLVMKVEYRLDPCCRSMSHLMNWKEQPDGSVNAIINCRICGKEMQTSIPKLDMLALESNSVFNATVLRIEDEWTKFLKV